MVIGVQFPSFSLVPQSKANYWEDVRDLCSAYGLVLDAWQENVLRCSLGERADGKWSAARVGLSVPRQNGKTAIYEARELAGLILFGEQLLIHSAHLVPTALESFHRIKHYFDAYDDLRKKVARIRVANGDQSIEMMSGQRLLFKARARGSGRGFSADVLMLDEAQILPARAWAAMLPSKSARPDPQVWLAGTPPGPEDEGEVFARFRETAKAGKDRRLCWMEWTAVGDPADPKVQATANPGYPTRPTPDAISDELSDLTPLEFGRERLGQWPDQSALGVFPSGAWSGCADKSSVPAVGAGRVFAVDVAPDQSWAAIGAAALRDDGLLHGQVVDHHRGTGWVVARVVELLERWGRHAPVALCGRMAAALSEPLEAAGVEVLVMSLADRVAACSAMYEAVAGTPEQVDDDGVVTPEVPPTFRHVAQPALDVAVGASKWKRFDDGRVWDRTATGDISPLYAVTGAVFAHASIVEDYDVLTSIY
jgi:hypothetical protein